MKRSIPQSTKRVGFTGFHEFRYCGIVFHGLAPFFTPIPDRLAGLLQRF
jgi:hypothetical protein